MLSDKSRKTGGGSATNAGTEYQAGVMAWLSATVIAGASASPPFGLPSDEKVVSVKLESQESVDDLGIETSIQRAIFVQAKRGIQLGVTATSEFGKTLEQFTKQYIQRTDDGLFDAAKDMYVLAAGDTSSQRVYGVAATVLNKLRKGTDPKTFNDDEQKAYKVIADHIGRVWRENKQTAIEDVALAQILKVTYIQKVDVIDEGSDAKRGKDMLRCILDKPEQDAAAWGVLLSEGLTLARQKGKVTYASLEQLLRGKALSLKSPIEFHKDIAELQKYTEQTLKSIGRSSSIKLSGKEVKVERSVVKELYDQTKSGQSFIVVGEPGAGKSGALYEVLEKLKQDGSDIVAIATEKIAATSPGALRNELGLENDLCEVLDNWKGVGRSVLVIDALDAARDPHAADLFLDIARSTLELPGKRWSVIISIRKYDLRYNNKIKEVFPQQQISQFTDAEFKIAHVNIPLFDDAEIEQLKAKSPELKGLIEKAGKKMEQLLRSPFNLSIAAEIMAAGVQASDLTQVQSQLELLDRYWGVRVAGNDDKQGDARNALIAAALKVMVEQQSLKIGRQELIDKQPMMSEQLAQLLSRNVLVEDKTTNLVGFYHHILYDYGIYRTVLRAGANGFVQLVKDNPYLALSVRPSIQMYWQFKWQQDETRKAYWSEVMELEGDPNITKLAKIFGADFAVGVVKSETDIEPLLEAMMSADKVVSEKAQAVIRRCSNAMSAAQKRSQEDGARHWVKLAGQALQKFTDYPMRLKLCSILESAIETDGLTPEQLKVAGAGVRRLLEVEMEQEPPNDWIVRTSIKLIALTYGTDPGATSKLLGRLLEPEMVAKYGYVYLRSFADNAGELADKDPALVEALYDTAFSHEEKEDEVTSISNSQILGLTSNRKQDYGMVHHQLGWSFAKVIEKDLPLALRIFNNVLSLSVKERDWRLSNPRVEGKFVFEGESATIIEDASFYWNEELSIGNDGSDTLESYHKFVKQLSEQEQGGEQLKDAIKTTASHNKAAVYWRVILQTAEQYPDTLGISLTQLLTAQPILTFDDTAHQASKFMAKVHPLLNAAKRAEIEDAVMGIPAGEKNAKRRKRLEELRDGYLLALDETALVTERARTRRTELDKEKPKEAFLTPFSSEGGSLSDEDLDRVLGRKPNPQNSFMKALAERAQTPLGTFRSSTLRPEEAKQLLDLIDELKDALSKNKEADVGWQDVIRDKIINASSMLICSALYTPASPEWPCLRSNIIEGTGLDAPVFDKECDDAFSKDGIIYGAAPRSSAAHALMALANKEADSPNIEEIRNLVRAMAKDAMAAVRASVASEVHLLWKKDDPSFAWEIADHFATTETSPEVVKGLLYSLGRLRNIEPVYVSKTTVSIYAHWKGVEDKTLRQTAAINLAFLYVDGNNANAKKELQAIIDEPAKHHEELERTIVHLRERLIHGIDDPSDEDARALRARATWVMKETLSKITAGLAAWEKKHAGKRVDELTEEDKEEIRALRGNIENIAMQIYFASGSFKEKNNEAGLGESGKTLFIKEQDELIKAVAATGDVKSAYEFVGMGLAYQDVDPVWSLKLVENAVRSSVGSGSAYESLMASSIAIFVKQFIARHRQHLQDKANQQSLMNILDEFVDVGWPEAINLTQDLEEIFR